MWPPPTPTFPPAGVPRSTCRRVTAARPSTKLKAASTASTWAIDTTVAASGGPNAHSSDTLLGAEKVASMARTVGRLRPGQPRPAVGMATVDQRPQIVGLDHPDQAQLVGQPARPHPGRLARAQVVVLEPGRHLAEHVLGVGQLRQPQHRRSPGRQTWGATQDRHH